MPQLTFFPLGNADSCLLDLAGGGKVLFDYANVGNADDTSDLRIDLERAIRDDLANADRDYFDVVAFTHLDNDHICGASEIFCFDHASKYQNGDRVKINELWVPAAAIVEDALDGEARIVQAEARHRLKEGSRIRVFSRPDLLKDWLLDQSLTIESRRHLIVDAGQVVPTFSKERDGVEFFVHSPFAERLSDSELVDRNTCSIVVHATFEVDGVETKVLLGSDAEHDMLSEIVQITKYHGKEERLEWDVVKLPHHCSYLSLGPEKGTDKTEPVENVAWLYEHQGNKGGKIVSPSNPIPLTGDDVQPPHRQAANYYRSVLASGHLDGQFLVTMEHPSKAAPKPLVIVIDRTKARVRGIEAGAGVIVSRSAPRAGRA